MNYPALLPYVLFFVGMYYLVTRKRTGGEVAAFLLAAAGALPFLDGGVTLVREFGRWEHGSVGSGVVTARYSSTGEDGSRTIGGSRFSRGSWQSPWIRTGTGFRTHDVVTRILLTGSTDAWVIDYRAPCDLPGGCHFREFVRHDLWTRLQVGDRVNVRRAKYQNDRGRLDENSMWKVGAYNFAIGSSLGLLAALVVRGWRLPRRRKYRTAEAVITSVEAMRVGGKMQWRVGFAYFSADGRARQCEDEVYVPGLKPGDACSAVYPLDRPDLGTLDLTSRAAAA